VHNTAEIGKFSIKKGEAVASEYAASRRWCCGNICEYLLKSNQLPTLIV
jgi:hypothetical protein